MMQGDMSDFLCDEIDLSKPPRMKISDYKIQPGSKYEKLACEYIEDSIPIRLVTDLINVAMSMDGKKTNCIKTSYHYYDVLS